MMAHPFLVEVKLEYGEGYGEGCNATKVGALADALSRLMAVREGALLDSAHDDFRLYLKDVRHGGQHVTLVCLKKPTTLDDVAFRLKVSANDMTEHFIRENGGRLESLGETTSPEFAAAADAVIAAAKALDGVVLNFGDKPVVHIHS